MLKSEWKHFFVRGGSGQKLADMREELDREINSYLQENVAAGWRIVSIECLQRDRTFDVTAEAEYRFFWQQDGAAAAAVPADGSVEPAEEPEPAVQEEPVENDSDLEEDPQPPAQEETAEDDSKLEEDPQPAVQEETAGNEEEEEASQAGSTKQDDSDADFEDEDLDEDFGIEPEDLQEQEEEAAQAAQAQLDSPVEEMDISADDRSAIEKKASLLSEIFSDPVEDDDKVRLQLSPAERDADAAEESEVGHEHKQ